ncbi:diaminopimelate epimerase, partial [Klebsiella pneumoniae]|nr:diaminopimelate epimerase [Klebsiella pneumoniae]
LSMGNPHCVLFLEDISTLPIAVLGSEIARHPRFPEGVNVEFAQVIAADHLNLRVFERGAGETLACGSGACAAVVAGILQGKLAASVKVT